MSRRASQLKYSRVSQRLVRAATPAAEPCACVPLSAIDAHPFVRGMSVTCAFVYPQPALDVEAMAASLSRTLSRYPVVAGRLRRSRSHEAAFEVTCNNAGAEFSFFRCDGTVSDFDGYGDSGGGGQHMQPAGNRAPAAFCARMQPFDSLLSGNAALAHFRVTHLRDGGSILGFSCSHALADGASALAFVEAWAAEHAALLTGCPAALPRFGAPVFDREALSAAARVPPELPASTVANTAAGRARMAALAARITLRSLAGRGRKVVVDALRPTATFVVPLSSELIARARAAAPGTSANDVAVGISWALLCAVRHRGSKSPLLGESHALMQTADLRRYLPGLPASFFGNCSWGVLVTAQPGARSPLQLAAACRAAMAEFCDSALLFEQLDGLLRPHAGASWSALRQAVLPAFCDGVFSSWNWPPLWAIRFGGATPVWISGNIFPATPWGFQLLAGRPDQPGLLLMGTCPRSKLEHVKAAASSILEALRFEAESSPSAA